MKSEHLYAEWRHAPEFAAYKSERYWRDGSDLVMFYEWRNTPDGRRLLGFAGRSRPDGATSENVA